MVGPAIGEKVTSTTDTQPEQGFSLHLHLFLILKPLLPVKHLSLPFQQYLSKKNTQYPKVLYLESHPLALFPICL